jgi:hypothetical protein
MADPVKFLSQEIALSTSVANTVGLASLVRLFNTDTANSVLVTLKNSGGTTLATFTLGHSGTGFCTVDAIKQPTDTLTITGTLAASGCKATSIGYY